MSQAGRERGQYRIHAVADMTGVPAATLRAWERRYGIPAPARTTSSYRLYSDDDVDRIRRLRDLCARGVAPAEAARMLKSSSEGLGDATPGETDAFDAAVRRLELAAESYDVQAIELEARNALFLGSATTVFERVIAPAQVRIGDRWHEGTLSVAQEHLASEVLTAVARDLLRLIQSDDAPRTALAACLGHEEHVLPLLGIGFRLAGWGFRVVMLGARTPPEALADAVASVRPDLVALSCTLPPADAAGTVRAYARACGSTAWVLGGRALRDLQPHVEAAGGIPGTTDDFASLRARIDDAMARRGMAQA